MKRLLKRLVSLAIATNLSLNLVPKGAVAEQRNLIAHPRTDYQLAFYKRHRRSYRVASALHFAHSKLHDVLLLTPFENHQQEDDKLYKEVLNYYHQPPKIEPPMELFAPYAARATWRLFRTIDSVHLLHEMTEDVMSDSDIAWADKGEKLRDVYDYYQKAYRKIALSPAPLDITMRRAGVMMKPYFSLTRNYYPQNNNFFYAAHWWHPALYETMMISGNGDTQDQRMNQMEDVFKKQVVPNPPMRMILSRELTPRYSRLSPETANVFDNLHMLHGITYDIFAYDGWSIKEKKAELYRVLDAMAYHPGDEQWSRKFKLTNPDVNPLEYDAWAQSAEGEMTRMMLEMLDEMMPMMMENMPGHSSDMKHDTIFHEEHQTMTKHQGLSPMTEQPMSKPRVNTTTHPMRQMLRDQLRLKLTPGIQQGEIEGSFMDAMRVLMPQMQMNHEGMKPGKINPVMVDAMLNGWMEKYANLPDVKSLPMDIEPSGADFY